MSTAGRDAVKRGVTRRAAGAGPGIGLLAEVPGLLGDESERSRRLLAGLMAGALVGAALAGFLLRPRHGRSRRRGS